MKAEPKDYEYWLVKDKDGMLHIGMTYVYGDFRNGPNLKTYVVLTFCGDEEEYGILENSFELIRRIELEE